MICGPSGASTTMAGRRAAPPGPDRRELAMSQNSVSKSVELPSYKRGDPRQPGQRATGTLHPANPKTILGALHSP